MKMELKIFKDKNEVAEKFCAYLENLITVREAIYIALSGGSTPKIVFDRLAQNYSHLDWSNVHLFWGDERCVPPTHEDSNYKMTVDHLLSKIVIPKENIHRIKGEAPPAEEAETYGRLLERVLPKHNGIPQFDLVMLGMGSDGHTVSIFPNQIDLWSSEKWCEVADHPTNGQKRVTITGTVINHAREVAFLVTGAEKQEKVTEILQNKPNSKLYPAALVAPDYGRLSWFLDEAAAGGI